MKISQLKVKLRLFYTIFISAPKDWQFPKKAEILIFDATNINALMPYLKNYNFTVMPLRGEIINIPCLLYSFLEFSFWNGDPLDAYISAYIKKARPRVIITIIDNYKRFYSISKRFSNLKTISIQNGLRGKSGDIFDGLIKSDNYHVDYMLVANKAIGKHYLKYLTGKAIPIGMLNNNAVYKSTPVKSDDILFISQWYKKPKNNEPLYIERDGTLISWEVFFAIEIKVIKLLVDWCIKNNKKLKVCGREKEKNGHEQNFYNNYLKQTMCDWEYIPRKDYYSSYNLIDKSQIIVSIDSTLGYESLARGKRTAFFSCRGGYLNTTSYRFGWPLKLSNKGPIWVSNQDELGFQLPKILNYLNAISDDDWTKLCQNYKNLVMEFDQGNTRFVKLLDQLLSGKEIKNYVN